MAGCRRIEMLQRLKSTNHRLNRNHDASRRWIRTATRAPQVRQLQYRSIFIVDASIQETFMRAVLCTEWGGPEKLVVEDVASPAIKEGAVRIAVQAAGINFADLLLISGQYQEKPAFPFTPGMECSGTVTEIGAGVSNIKVG